MGTRRAEQMVLAGQVLATLGFLAIGGSWDAHWHWTVGRDSTWIPPHLLLYSGIVLNAVLAGLMLGRGRRDPAALFTVSGVGTVLAAAIFDGVWHLTIGDRMVWSPPHVLFVVGSLGIAIGLTAAFTRAGRLGIISPAAAAWGVRTFAGALLVASYFGQLPTATLVFHPEAADKTLLFQPTPMTLLIFLSGVMPAAIVLALKTVGGAAPVLVATSTAFWGAQQFFHLALTSPVAAALGFAVKVTPLMTWPFELAIFGVSLAPLVLIGPRFIRQPELAGAVAGALYALAIQLGLILADAPFRVTPAAALFSTLLGTMSGLAGSWFADRIWGMIGLIPRPKPRPS